MIEKYNRLSFAFGIPGLILQVLGRFKMHVADGPVLWVWTVVALFGTILFIGFDSMPKQKVVIGLGGYGFLSIMV